MISQTLSILAPLALLFPGPGAMPAARGGAVAVDGARLAAPAAGGALARLPGSAPAPAAPEVARQVSIMQHFSIRITPGAPARPPEMLDQLQHDDGPRDGAPQRFEPRRIGRCLAIGAIGAVQGGEGNRLLLFMRDQHIIVAALERACQAADFYSGFYVARNADGLLCVDRDRLQSRSGANCKVKALRVLAPMP